MLETAPSLSIYSNNKDDVIEAEDGKENGSGEKDANFTRKVTIEVSGDFSFAKAGMDLIKEDEEISDGLEKLGIEHVDKPSSPSMYLATGLGLHDGGHDFGEILMGEISEDYCIELLEEYPNHPLVLRKYAELLQGKGDRKGAEEYYFRAAQVDPGDGEVIWELHHDHKRALTYFDLAAQSGPDNSNVMAAYAKFLWETEDDGEDQSALPDSIQENNPQNSAHLNPKHDIDIDTDDIGSYYKRMIDENPSHPIFLKKYAQFLYQSKGDLRGAEEYYSRAILAEPQDGEMLSQFATLLWETYHDHDRTLNYLERAIEAAPTDSDVLAAYARILWTMDDE